MAHRRGSGEGGAYEGDDNEPVIPPQVLEQSSPCVHAEADADDGQGA